MIPRLALVAAMVVLAVVGAAPAAHAQSGTNALTIEKVDAQGKLLPGATFEMWACYLDEVETICTDLNLYDAFASLTTQGSTFNAVDEEIYTGTGWSLPVTNCLIIRELTAPPGYVLDGRPAMVCKGPGGWNTANAAGITLTAGGTTYSGDTVGLGGWTATVEKLAVPDGDGGTLLRDQSYLRLANTTITTVTAPSMPATTDPCNPVGVTANVTWQSALPAATATIRWSEDPTTEARTATLVNSAAQVWSSGGTAPLAFSLPADSVVACPPSGATTPPARGIGANTGIGELGIFTAPLLRR